MIRYLVWDVDGTLFDTYPAIARAMNAALEMLGGKVSLSEVEQLSKISMGHCLTTLSAEHNVDAEALRSMSARVLASYDSDLQPPFPGVMALCHYVREIGGANLILTHRRSATLDVLLTNHQMTTLFTDIITADDDFPRKPDPTGLNDLLARNSVPREQALMIGDREMDVLVAHAAGVRACFYGSNLCEAPAAFVVTDYADLLSAIQVENGIVL